MTVFRTIKLGDFGQALKLMLPGVLLLFAVNAHAQSVSAATTGGSSVLGIAAIVNDEVISRYDLEQRVGLVVTTAGIQPTAENVNRIQTQVLRSLVDEKLQLQEANRLEIKVTEEEVEAAFDQIAARNNMSGNDIKQFLVRAGVSVNALRGQLESDIAWNKVVSQQFGGRVRIGEEEIKEVIARLQTNANQPRYLVSEILLTFDEPSQEREIAAGAQRLVEQMRGGAPFQAVAQQFSQSASAATGGDIGWIQAGQLRAELADVISTLATNTISDPIRTVNGFYILQVRGKQNGLGPDPMLNQFELIQVILPLAPDAPAQEVNRRATQAQKLVADFKTCALLPDLAAKISDAEVSPARTIAAGQLDPQLQNAVLSREAGEMLPPLRSPRGLEMIAICDRKDHQGGMPERDAIEDNLFSQQLAMMARRHLRDLRRDAVVETR